MFLLPTRVCTSKINSQKITYLSGFTDFVLFLKKILKSFRSENQANICAGFPPKTFHFVHSDTHLRRTYVFKYLYYMCIGPNLMVLKKKNCRHYICIAKLALHTVLQAGQPIKKILNDTRNNYLKE